MKNYLILLFLCFSFISCNNPTNPVTNNNQIISFEAYTFRYDTIEKKWKDSAFSVIKGQMDLSRPAGKYYSFNGCWGKNWQKGIVSDKLGCYLNFLRTNLISGSQTESIFTYDNQGYLISEESKVKGITKNKIIYNVINGKIISEEGYFENDEFYSKKLYEYDNSGYICKTTTTYNNNNKTIYEYVHDNNGYLIKEIHYYNNQPLENNFEYDANGFLVKEKESSSTKTYKYNVMGQMTQSYTETISNIDIISVTYDNNGFPVEYIYSDSSKTDNTKEQTKQILKILK